MLPRLTPLALLLLSAVPVSAADPPGAAKAAAGVKEVIGHRGSSADRPENTVAGVLRAAEAGAHAAEVDVRTTKDGALVCLHDADVGRTTDGTGKLADLTLAEVKKLDAGAKFDPTFKGERVPTLREVLAAAKGKVGVMLDLKEEGERYAEAVAAEVRAHGEPARVVLGVRSLDHAARFRKLLPEARQIGLVPTPADIEPFAKAGVPVIRLWPKWLTDASLVPKVRALGRELHLGTGGGTRAEVLPLLAHRPESLSSDDPARLVQTLAVLRKEAGAAGPAVRVVAFGDSLTAPRGPLVTYATLLARELPGRGAAVELLNAGVPGNTTVAARARYKRDVLDRRPDVVLILLGTNDAMVDVWKTPPGTEPRVPPATTAGNLRYFVRAAREAGARPVLLTPVPIRWTDKLKGLYGKPPYDPADPMGLNVTLVTAVEAARAVAREERVPLVDLYAAFVEWGGVPGNALDSLYLDGMHPNDRGHRLAADRLVPVVAGLLAPERVR